MKRPSEAPETIDDLTRSARMMLRVVGRSRSQYFPTAVFGHRSGELVAVATFEPNRDLMMLVIEMMVSGFRLSSVGFVCDTYSAPTTLNPQSGRPWKQGEMGDLAHYARGVERGWVTDALMIGWGSRESDSPTVEIRMLPYRMEDDGRVEFMKAPPHSATFAGPTKAALLGILAAPDVWSAEDIDSAGLSPDVVQLAMDASVVRAVLRTTGVVVGLIAEPGSPRANLAVDLSPERN
jgi:hypothetical protein